MKANWKSNLRLASSEYRATWAVNTGLITLQSVGLLNPCGVRKCSFVSNRRLSKKLLFCTKSLTY